MTVLTDEQKEKVKITPLADKYKVSKTYVGLVIVGKRQANTSVSKNILRDAKKIVKIIETEPKGSDQ